MIKNYKTIFKLDYDPATTSAGITAQSKIYGKVDVNVDFTTAGTRLGDTLSLKKQYYGKPVIDCARELILELKKEIRSRFYVDDEFKCIHLNFNFCNNLDNIELLIWVECNKNGGRKDGVKTT